MSEYKGLKYKTRGNASPQGRPRVFFCCHPEDFERMFEPITNEILNIQLNAAIWYYDPKKGIPAGDEFLADLSQMQLFVVPVTANFLNKENSARTVEFAYALDYHIPVLPLMQEANLESDFNHICGNLQFLDKYTSEKDFTAIPYEEKLKKYLESVLVSDELTQKIRDAFDAYIFLSYRKKDRKYAQQIMHLIHQNDFCRDIAIWYDEFLIPGENFNDAIERAMQKSSLFAMVVTPSLLENPNYVMAVEYPEARKIGKPILPIEGLPTDDRELAKLYDGIDTTLGSEQISEKLHEVIKEIALSTDKKDPSHIFLMGLAYLSGIDVEVDHEKALELITTAAEANLPEAYEKLVAMYQNGDGVERNYDTAIEWQKRYVEFLKKDYKENNCTAAKKVLTYVDLIENMRRLGSYQYDCRKLGESKETYLKLLKYAKIVNFDAFTKPYVCISYDSLGDISMAEENLEEAMTWYLKSLEIRIEAADEKNTTVSRRDLSISYDNLGDNSKAEGKLEEAKTWYLKALKIRKAVADKKNTTESRRDLSVSYSRLGNISEAEGKLEEAKTWYLETLEISKEITEETNTIEARQDLSTSYDLLANISKAEGKLEEAKTWYLKALEIRETIDVETNTIESRSDLSNSYSILGDISKAEGNLEEAKTWYLKALEIRKAVAEEINTIESINDLGVSYGRLAALSILPLSQRLEYLEKLLFIGTDLFQRTGIPRYKLFIEIAENELKKLKIQ